MSYAVDVINSLEMYYLISISLIIICLFSSAQAQQNLVPGKYHWQKRILIIYAETENSPDYQKQLKEFSKEKRGLEERDLVTFHVLADKVITPTDKTLSAKSVKELRQQYSISESGLTVVLVGKDGGEKLTQSGMLTTDQLFGIIDQMPMRKQEMNKSN